MTGKYLIIKEHIAAQFKTSKDCSYRMNGNKCCHGANPVKGLGCNEICGRDAASWLEANRSDFSTDKITKILEGIVIKK